MSYDNEKKNLDTFKEDKSGGLFSRPKLGRMK